MRQAVHILRQHHMGSSAPDGKNGGWEAGVIAARVAGGASVEEYLAIFATPPHGSAGSEERLPRAHRRRGCAAIVPYLGFCRVVLGAARSPRTLRLHVCASALSGTVYPRERGILGAGNVTTCSKCLDAKFSTAARAARAGAARGSGSIRGCLQMGPIGEI